MDSNKTNTSKPVAPSVPFAIKPLAPPSPIESSEPIAPKPSSFTSKPVAPSVPFAFKPLAPPSPIESSEPIEPLPKASSEPIAPKPSSFTSKPVSPSVPFAIKPLAPPITSKSIEIKSITPKPSPPISSKSIAPFTSKPVAPSVPFSIKPLAPTKNILNEIKTKYGVDLTNEDSYSNYIKDKINEPISDTQLKMHEELYESIRTLPFFINFPSFESKEKEIMVDYIKEKFNDMMIFMPYAIKDNRQNIKMSEQKGVLIALSNDMFNSMDKILLLLESNKHYGNEIYNKYHCKTDFKYSEVESEYKVYLRRQIKNIIEYYFKFEQTDLIDHTTRRFKLSESFINNIMHYVIGIYIHRDISKLKSRIFKSLGITTIGSYYENLKQLIIENSFRGKSHSISYKWDHNLIKDLSVLDNEGNSGVIEYKDDIIVIEDSGDADKKEEPNITTTTINNNNN